jgi:hypothetical protein
MMRRNSSRLNVFVKWRTRVKCLLEYLNTERAKSPFNPTPLPKRQGEIYFKIRDII